MAKQSRDGHADKGVSLARGPALVLGSILLTAGLLAFLADGTSPTDGFPDGTVKNAEKFFGFGVNDWTAMITAAAGGLLLFGAAQHLLARTMSLVVGLALGACSVIALVDGDDVLGLAAANGPTKLFWGVAAALLLINALLPRKGGGKDRHDDDDDLRREPAVAPRRETVERERVEPVATRREPVATRAVAEERVSRGEVGDSRTERFARPDDQRVGERDNLAGGERRLDVDDPRDRPVSDDRPRDSR